MKEPTIATAIFLVLFTFSIGCRHEADDPGMALIGTWVVIESNCFFADCDRLAGSVA